MENFKKSGIVICINDNFGSEAEKILFKPIKGSIYTIREIIETKNGIGFLLEEIANSNIKFNDRIAEPCFKSDRFRPINEVGNLSDSFLENFKEIKESEYYI